MATTVPSNSLGVFLRWMRRSASFLWLAVLAGYLSLLAGQAVLRTYQAQQDTVSLQQQLSNVRLEKQRLQALLVYYGTDSYKQEVLRQSLLMVSGGQKLYALPESSTEVTAEEEVHKDITASTSTPLTSEPIWKQWVLYLEGHR